MQIVSVVMAFVALFLACGSCYYATKARRSAREAWKAHEEYKAAVAEKYVRYKL